VIADVFQEGVRSWWAPALAFAAGVVSFASPCVLPLVPGYLSFVTGEQAVAASGAGEAAPVPTRRRMVPILLFILGFSVLFTLIGAFTGTLSQAIKSPTGQRVAGAFVLLFGLFLLLYALRVRVPWLYREERPLLSRVRPGPAWAFPLGMAFAVGWTPCIGPVLGAIITLAANQGSGRASVLLFVYSLGLGIPFLLVGLGLGKLMGVMRFFSSHYGIFAGVSGALLIVIGSLLVTGAWTRLTAPLFEVINRFTPAI
jgi:cytochrome c-type biogenesis protein